MKLNNPSASPGFSAGWRRPARCQRWLYTPAGKPRYHHVDCASPGQRADVRCHHSRRRDPRLGWEPARDSSLRAIVYMDEILVISLLPPIRDQNFLC